MAPEEARSRATRAARNDHVPDFIRNLRFEDLPADVIKQARRCLLDLIGVAAAGSRTAGSQIACRHATQHMRGSEHESRMMFDGRNASPAGAAFAGAAMLDSFDAHDGHVLVKGHVGVATLPALLAFVDSGAECDDREFLTCMVIGYEIGTRSGIAMHGSVADYHCSGSWNPLASAAVGARLMNLDNEQTRHALGIAEYWGTRGQMMRCCDSPSMIKDGSSWGAHGGVTAVLLARDGFTGAPAITVEREDVAATWSDLGERWRIREQYFKPYPVCRWAQPAVEAALSLQRETRFTARDIAKITIESFREAVVLGAACAIPADTEQAQYSLTFPVAASLVFGRLGAEEIAMPGLTDPDIRRLLQSMELIEDREFSRRFPAERWARVRIVLSDGRLLASVPTTARGDAESPLSDDEICAKYRCLTAPVLGDGRTLRIEQLVDTLAVGRSVVPELLAEVMRNSSDR